MILHTGDFNPTTTFRVDPCEPDSVYVSGLQQGEYLYSAHPFYVMKEDGLFYGFNDTFREIYHMNKQHQRIETFEVTFISSCETVSEIFPLPLTIPHSTFEPVAMFSVVLFVTVSLFVKRRLHG